MLITDEQNVNAERAPRKPAAPTHLDKAGLIALLDELNALLRPHSSSLGECTFSDAACLRKEMGGPRNVTLDSSGSTSSLAEPHSVRLLDRYLWILADERVEPGTTHRSLNPHRPQEKTAMRLGSLWLCGINRNQGAWGLVQVDFCQILDGLARSHYGWQRPVHYVLCHTPTTGSLIDRLGMKVAAEYAACLAETIDLLAIKRERAALAMGATADAAQALFA